MAGLKVSILGPKIDKNGGFHPSNLLRGTYEHLGPIGDNKLGLFQDIPRRVAKFREIWPKTVWLF